MNTLKYTLFNNWHLMRWIRLVFGLLIAYQAIVFTDALSGIIAAFFLFQAVTNTGCCGTQGCAVPMTKTGADDGQDISYEEIKK